MKTYIVIDNRHFCWIVFVGENELNYLTVSDMDLNDCSKIVEDSKVQNCSKPDKHKFRLDNYSEKFFDRNYLWFDVSSFPA
jgi:hypothetical protein